MAFFKYESACKSGLGVGYCASPNILAQCFLEPKLALPSMERELRRKAASLSNEIALEVSASGLLSGSIDNQTMFQLEKSLVEKDYLFPSIVRIDILGKSDSTGLLDSLLSSTKIPYDQVSAKDIQLVSVETWARAQLRGLPVLEGLFPIRDPATQRPIGNIRIVISTSLENAVLSALWRSSIMVVGLMLILFVVAFNFAFKRMVQKENLHYLSNKHGVDTEFEALELEQRRARNDKLSAMEKLASTLAQEVGSPLTAVSAHLELLRSEINKTIDLEKSDNKDQFFQIAGKSLARLNTVTDQLNRIEKTISGFLTSTAKPVALTQLIDLNRLIKTAVDIVQPRLSQAGITLKCQLDRDVRPIRIVPHYVEQVILNLINNAIDSLQKKADSVQSSRLIEIKTSAQKQDGMRWASISIFDTGTGIEASSLDRIFEPFFTTKYGERGKGLGLSISKELIEKNGGSLEIESEQDGWTKAVVKIPYGMVV